MALAVKYQLLNRYAVGTGHGQQGLDYFSLPRGWINLHQGVSMYRTSASNYGPWASVYLSHPFVALALGPILSQFSPWIGYGVFVLFSLALLVVSAMAISAAMSRTWLRLLAPPMLFCAIPTYLMLWNAQPHVFVVVSLSLLFTGMARLGRGVAEGSERLIVLGLLASLLSKPIVLLALPAIVSVRRLRRSVLLALTAYVAISGLCVALPQINPERASWSAIVEYVRHGAKVEGLLDNLCHWLSIVRQGGSIDRAQPELFGFPNFVRDSYGPNVPLSLFQLPIVFVVVFSFANGFVPEQRLATRNALVLCICATAAHFLGYTLVWEYHYAMLLVAVPFLCAEWLDAPRGIERTLAFAAVLASVALYAPTPYFLWPHDAGRHLVALRLLRVVPPAGIYGSGMMLVALRIVQGLRQNAMVKPERCALAEVEDHAAGL
jgi:hypothetical protein